MLNFHYVFYFRFSETPLDSFWKHEWQKHGTCAMSLENLNTELKYFAQGLRWLQLYSMSNILSKAGIVPSTNKTYSATEVINTCEKKYNISVPKMAKSHICF